jgi:hypothetical protein
MIVNGDLKSASIETFATVDLPSANIKARLIREEETGVVYVSNGTRLVPIQDVIRPTISIPALNLDWNTGSIFYKEATANFSFTMSNEQDGKSINFAVFNNSGAGIVITPPVNCVYNPSVVLTVLPFAHVVYKIIYINGTRLMYAESNTDASTYTQSASVDYGPVGTFVHSMLTEVQFKSFADSVSPYVRWVLADGRNVSGSNYHIVTGNVLVPNANGRFLRGKGANNPDGDLALGTYTASRNLSHSHVERATNSSGAISNAYALQGGAPEVGNPFSIVKDTVAGTYTSALLTTAADGGNDAAPANITANIFIRID